MTNNHLDLDAMDMLIRIASCLIGLTLVVPTQVAAQPPVRERKFFNLLKDPQWEHGLSRWPSRGVEIVVDDTKRVAVVGPEEGLSYLSHTVMSPPSQVLLTATFRYRLKESDHDRSKSRLSLAVSDPARSRVPTGFTVRLPETGDQWESMESTCVLPANAAALRVTLTAEKLAKLEVSDFEIRSPVPARHPSLSRPPGPPKAQPTGPAVLRSYAGTSVAAGVERRGVVTFPIPGAHAQQVPLSFAVTTDPVDALKSFRWRPGTDGENLLCEVTVELGPDDQKADVSWESYVFVDSRTVAELPAAQIGEFPESVSQWTEPSACVQSDNEKIRSKAEELFEANGPQLEDYVRSVITFTRSNRGQDPKARLRALDAVQALDCGGSCTSRANLCAALLRAQGIPARTQSHLPVWAGDTLYQHWLVEYWHPGKGWTWVEPTRGQMQPPPWTLVVLHVSEPEDEDLAFDQSITHSGVASGVAKWSVHNIAPPLRRDRSRTTKNGADLAFEVKAESAERADFAEAARTRFSNLVQKAFDGQLPATHDPRVLKPLLAGKLPPLPLHEEAGKGGPETHTSSDDQE